MAGDQKWINLSFVAAAGVLAWVLNQSLLIVVRYGRIQNPTVLGVVSASAIVSVVVCGAFVLWYARREKVQSFMHEVFDEMKKVVWPPKKNAYFSTIVVLVSCVIMAVILGLFDWLCANLVGLVINA